MPDFLEFLRANYFIFVTVSALVTITGFLLFPLRWMFRHKKTPDKVIIANPEILDAARSAPAAPAEPVITLTLEQFEARIARREDRKSVV